MKRRIAVAAILGTTGATAVTTLQATRVQAAQPVVASEQYAYQSAAFREFIADSYKEVSKKAPPFYAWLETAYARNPKAQLAGPVTLEAALQARGAELNAIKDVAQRAQLERDTGAWLHRLVKAVIPRFSLERGFEFVNAMQLGERQCLLQSVLIAGLAQAMQIDAGVAMVWRNEKAQASNLGHMVTVFKLSSGLDVLVDASDPQPFMGHQGLLMRDATAGDWRFLEPSYDAQANITAYKRSIDGVMLPPEQVRGLSAQFLRSQFYYYRGERAPGGFFGPSNNEGLNASAKFLETAQRIDPSNPLAVYVLGLIYRKQGRASEAKTQLEKGFALYQRYGYVPEGPRSAVAGQ